MRSFLIKIIIWSAIFSIVTLFVIDRFGIDFGGTSNCQIYNDVQIKSQYGYTCDTLGFPFSYFESDIWGHNGVYFTKNVILNFLGWFILYGVGVSLVLKILNSVLRKSGYQITSPSQAFSSAAQVSKFGDFFNKKLIWALSIIGIPGFGYTLFVLITEREYGWFAWRILYPLVITLFLLGIVLLVAIIGRAVRRFTSRNQIAGTQPTPIQTTKSWLGLILTFGYFIFIIYAIFSYYIRLGGCNELGCSYELLLLFSLLPWSLLFEVLDISSGPFLLPLAIIFALFNGTIIYYIARWIGTLAKSFIRKNPSE